MIYSSHFVGHFDLNERLIKDIRKLLRLSGYRLWVRGSNPNRKQHKGQMMPTIDGRAYTISHAALRQSIPLKYSTYGRFYVRKVDLNTSFNAAMTESQAKDAAVKVVTEYLNKGIDIKTNVPARFKA